MVQDLENEIWYSIKRYEGIYEISNKCRVKSKARLKYKSIGCKPYKTKEKILKTHVNHKGYITVELSKNSKRNWFMIHRLIAEILIPNIDNKPQINHKNGIKSDNRIENLEWCTNSENQIHSYSVLNRVRPPKGVLPTCHEFNTHNSKKVSCDTLGITFSSMREADKELGFYRGCIQRYMQMGNSIIDGLSFRHI